MSPIKNISPSQSDPKKILKVPEGYFESLEPRIYARIRNTGSPEKSNRRRQVWLNQLALAASLLIFAMISYAVVNSALKNNRENNAQAGISEMIEYELELYDETTLFEAYADLSDPISEEDNYDAVVIDFLVNEEIEMDLIVAAL
jgi:hypothetical protein